MIIIISRRTWPQLQIQIQIQIETLFQIQISFVVRSVCVFFNQTKSGVTVPDSTWR